MSREQEAIDCLSNILATRAFPENLRKHLHTAIGAIKKQIPSYGYSVSVHEDPLVPSGQIYFVCDGKIIGAITNLAEIEEGIADKGDSGE